MQHALDRLSVDDTRLLRLDDGRMLELTVSSITPDLLKGRGRSVTRDGQQVLRGTTSSMEVPRARIVAVCSAAPEGYQPTPWLLAGVAAVVVAGILLVEFLNDITEGFGRLN